jgi:pimeloyl-ACP methyl ester carboxylesterase
MADAPDPEAAMSRRFARTGLPLAVSGAVSAMLFCAQPAARADAPASGQILTDVIFSRYTEHSGNSERARRLLSPFSAARLERDLGRSGRTLTGQPVNLADEKFVVYLPALRPKSGFGLLVFVPPWQDARIPPGWAAAFDRYGIIFVSAARSGNDESAFDRREPLALLAADNVMAQYPVDPERVYIGGFSGGSRVALRVALGYPDLFRGALLNAGSDAIGSREVPLPPRDLFLKFQSTTRIVYVTGERDAAHAAEDMISLRSLHRWCVFNTDSQTEFRAEHAVAGAAALSGAVRYLLGDAQTEPHRLSACRSGVDAELAAGLQDVEALIGDARRAEAQKRLIAIDERFGGLAAPRSIDLATRLQ